ncbi:DNA polymerase III delta [Solidesulfovibrio carbinoliphilus subsp. oakridgensis]|uniref:DNA polymerase III delta n=1 Tax=Solidesulfovibrio carbinoliphilus subsp. oakridgensis TaxID=694327 RepID=G7Q6Z9_9BACT|nr:DNA polymerase III subunit delta [Solidesulfovibrio carbinoliphilus]EHJ48482.1 DNA polymerase III delta [Solidesulfovibrio carbinoliphilus subsp. oakridgensis]
MKRPGFTFLACPDPEITRERVDRLLAESGQQFVKEVFWGDEELSAPFWSALTVGSLFAGQRAVVVRRAEACPAELWPKLTSALSGFNASVWPFFCLEGPFDRKGPKIPKALADQPYFKVAGKRKWFLTVPGLTRRDMGPLLADWAARRRLAFEPGVAEGLAAALPPDLARADNELAKLELALGERTTIERGDLAEVSYHEGMDGFEFLDALAGGRDPASVWREIGGKQLAGEEMIFPFLGLLLYEARIMWRIAAGEAGDVRLPPYVLQKKQALARRLGASGLTRLFEAAFAAEAGIKSGTRRPDQAMEYLTAELFRLFGGNQGQRGRG